MALNLNLFCDIFVVDYELKVSKAMAIITLKIKDSKLSFFRELIKNLDFVQEEKVKESDSPEAEEEYREPTKEEIKENIRQGLREVKLIEEGKMKGIPARDLFEDL